MKEYFLNEVNSYVNYFGCLVLGVFVAEKYFPAYPERKGSFFHKFLISYTTICAGALLGSSFYNLTYPQSRNPEFDDSGCETG